MDGRVSITRFIQHRQREEKFNRLYQNTLHATDSWIQRLGLEYELEGHFGCVNCIEWNQKGDILASGSDDLNIILWDPFRHKLLQTIHSGHIGNIFSVKFLPLTNDQTLVSGAADSKLRVHDVHCKDTTMVCCCHEGRVKRIAVAPNTPFMFWSAAEDGLIMEFDLRTPHTCSNESSNVLINLFHHMGRGSEAKCLAINPLRTELIAVGANDPYVRLYDRRMISTTKVKNFMPYPDPEIDHLPTKSAQYFVAGHLPNKQQDYKKRFRSLASTYITFSPDGKELLANLGGEQIYLFNLVNPPHIAAALALNGFHRPNGTTINLENNPYSYENSLPPFIEKLKQKANEYFQKKRYHEAIMLYNQAITMYPRGTVLYGNRAAALMKRNWDGDLYSALKDCKLSLQLDPGYFKAHFRLIRCLYELHWTEKAMECLQLFKSRFPKLYSTDNCCQELERDIKAALAAEAKTKTEGASAAESKAYQHLSEKEKLWRAMAFDHEKRFLGHCNTTTDIKEANFFGSGGQYIIAGSDDGSFFIWNKKTTNIMRVLRGDDSIVNCLQPHPTTCLLATSGIDSVVRLWSPRPEDGTQETREVKDAKDAALANQRRMNADPLEAMLINMGFRIPTSDEGSIGPCRTS